MDSTPDPYELAATAADELRDLLGEHRALVVLGSGWSDVVERLGTIVASAPATALTGVPAPTVEGHTGMLHSVVVPGAADDTPVLVAAGRSHLYEGHSVATVVHTVRAAVLHGCGTVVLTNAAGSLRTDAGVGTPVLISDQLNLTGANPMCGAPPPAELPGRFVDLTALYAPGLRDAVRSEHPELRDGVYAGLLGGSFETPAEIRMLATLGADLVGMSTVLEAIAARHLGAEVLGVSLVTNLAAGLQATVDHLEVLSAGQAAGERLAQVLSTALRAG